MSEQSVADAAHKRLDRIEEKIDKLTGFMVGIARLEEKQTSIANEVQYILKRMEYTERRLGGSSRLLFRFPFDLPSGCP